jgi:hypothetical protein
VQGHPQLPARGNPGMSGRRNDARTDPGPRLLKPLLRQDMGRILRVSGPFSIHHLAGVRSGSVSYVERNHRPSQ